MFGDYQRLVIQDFEKKRAANNLSLRLVHPTASGLKKECIDVCLSRFDKKDENTLRVFFGEWADAKTYAKAISRCDTSKFKPLQNLINRRTHNPDKKNIELLAWLINFKQRPWELGKEYEEEDFGGVEEDPVVAEVAETIGNKEDNAGTDHKSSAPDIRKGARKWKLTIPILIAAFISIPGYMLWKKDSWGKGISDHQSCMYWNEYQYEQISCSKKPTNGALVIALDSTLLRNFKKIMTPDTITYNAIGRVWYIKKNGKLEYYTSNGRHPENPNLVLRPISQYMIKKYILQEPGN